MGDSLLMTHAHTGSGSRLPASTLAMSSCRGAWQGRGDGQRKVLNTRAVTTYERKAIRLHTYSPSGKDSFASLSLLGQGKVREMSKSQLVSAPVQPHPGPNTHLLLDKKPKNNPSWPPHPGPWEITSNSRTNLSHLLQMSDGKAAVLQTLLLPPSQESL